MTDTAVLEKDTTIDEIAPPMGGSLFNLYILDADTDPDDPKIVHLYTRGDDYVATQKAVRKRLSADPEDEKIGIFTDSDCTVPFEIEKGHNWMLALTRKQSSGGKRLAGVDKLWLRAVLDDPTKSAEEKIEAMKRFV